MKGKFFFIYPMKRKIASKSKQCFQKIDKIRSTKPLFSLFFFNLESLSRPPLVKRRENQMQKISAHQNKCSYRKTLRERHGYCEEDHGAPYEIQQWRSETTISSSVSFAKRIKETKKYGEKGKKP